MRAVAAKCRLGGLKAWSEELRRSASSQIGGTERKTIRRFDSTRKGVGVEPG